jgi:succinate dehydrogenase flavin-adding protein (antitoxin of CptAB toxin-antitoxin module)
MRKRKVNENTELKKLLRKKRYSYRVASKEIDISIANLNDKLNGYALFNPIEIKKLIELLDINHNDIYKYFLEVI